MNIALEKGEEWVNGQFRRSYGDAFVRGNNGRSNPADSSKRIVAAEHSSSFVYRCRLLIPVSGKRTNPTRYGCCLCGTKSSLGRKEVTVP